VHRTDGQPASSRSSQIALNSVSVIIPTYNRAEWVLGSIESALGQTRPPDEIIVIDDGSTDDTPRVLAGAPEGVRCFRQDNAGVSEARNRGVREATGRWIAFLDSDDRWYPEKLEIQLAALAATGADWSISNGHLAPGLDRVADDPPESFSAAFPLVAETGRPAGRWFETSDRMRPLSVDTVHGSVPAFVGDLFPVLLRGNLVQPTGMVIDRARFLGAGAFDAGRRMAGDTDFGLRLSAAGSPCVAVMRPLYLWVIGDYESITSSHNTAALVRNAIESLEHAVSLRDGGLTRDEAEALAWGRRKLRRRLAYTLLSDLERREARATAAEYLREGGLPDPVLTGIWLSSFLPDAALDLARRVKSRRP